MTRLGITWILSGGPDQRRDAAGGGGAHAQRAAAGAGATWQRCHGISM